METILKNVRDKITRIKFRMRVLRAKMACEDPIDPKMIEQYLELNEQLRGSKIIEAELCYIKNKL